MDRAVVQAEPQEPSHSRPGKVRSHCWRQPSARMRRGEWVRVRARAVVRRVDRCIVFGGSEWVLEEVSLSHLQH